VGSLDAVFEIDLSSGTVIPPVLHKQIIILERN
jgi:hypothetical protein